MHSGMAGDKYCGEVEVVYTIKQNGNIYKTGTLKVSDTESGVVQLPPGKYYNITAYAKKDYFISSDSSYKGFNVSRSTNYYVSTDGSYEALGTKKDPYKDFYTCVETIKNQISDYGEAAEYNIYVMSDFSVSDTDVILYLENETGAFNLNIIGYGSKRTMTCSENAISFIFLEWEKSVKIQNIKFTGNTAIIVKENSPGRSTVNLTLTDVEISGCRNNDPSSPVPPVVFTSSGILTIEDSTITQNTILANQENYDDGFTCISIDGCLNPPEIKGKVVIYDNFKVSSEDETQKCPANLSLLNNGPNQIPVKLMGPLSEGSKIGITTWNVPVTGITVPFTTGFATYHPGEAASKYFVGDVFTVITDNGEGALAVGGGTVSSEFYNKVVITPSTKVFTAGQEKEITFTVEAPVNGVTTDVSDKINVIYTKLYCQQDQVPSSYYSFSENTLTLKNTLVEANYNFVIVYEYNGKNYSSRVNILPNYAKNLAAQDWIAGTSTNHLVVKCKDELDLRALAAYGQSSSIMYVDVEVQNNIILTGNWTPIDRFYYSTFNGNGYLISGMDTRNVVNSDSNFGAFFNMVYGSTVKNVKISGNSNRAGLIGRLSNNSTVINCMSYVTINKSDSSNGCGGIAALHGGSNTETLSRIINCRNYGNITANNTTLN